MLGLARYAAESSNRAIASNSYDIMTCKAISKRHMKPDVLKGRSDMTACLLAIAVYFSSCSYLGIFGLANVGQQAIFVSLGEVMRPKICFLSCRKIPKCEWLGGLFIGSSSSRAHFNRLIAGGIFGAAKGPHSRGP